MGRARLPVVPLVAENRLGFGRRGSLFHPTASLSAEKLKPAFVVNRPDHGPRLAAVFDPSGSGRIHCGLCFEDHAFAEPWCHQARIASREPIAGP